MSPAGRAGVADILRMLDEGECELLQRELADHWLRQAQRAADDGDMDGAQRCLLRVAEDSEHWATARIRLGDIQHELGEWADAASNFALGLLGTTVAHDNVATYYQAAICGLEAGRTDVASDLLEAVQAFDPDYRDIDELLARLTWFGRRSPQPARVAAAVTSASRRFERGELLGDGANGSVYRARDTLLDRDVAVKVLSPEAAATGDVHTRFLREARAAAGLTHRNIVAVYDFGVAAGELFLAMELVSGPTLREVVRRDGPLSPIALRSVVDQACDALAYAHAKGVVHLDIKPANLLVNADGVLKIADFGLAKLRAPGIGGRPAAWSGPVLVANLDPVDPTLSMVPGTPLYMAPERIRGGPTTAAVDIYALGVTLFELATGELPFDMSDIYRLHFRGGAKRPSDLRKGLPIWVDSVVERCLRAAPEERYPSAEALQGELQAAAA